MVQLKALLVLIAAIINPSLKSVEIHNNEVCENKQLMFYSKSDTVILKEKEYAVKISPIGFHLVFLNKAKLKKIYKLYDPSFRACLNGELIVAKGIFVLSSAVPEGVDYFFTFGKDKRILKYDTLLFRKAPCCP